MSMKNILLLLSVSFNVALIYGLFTYKGNTAESKETEVPPVASGVQKLESIQGPAVSEARGIMKLAEVDFSTRDHYTLMAQLQEQGLPDEFVRRIMLASINMEMSELAREQKRNDAYWQSTKTNREEQVQRELGLAADKRTLLRQLFGDSVENDLVFEDLFRPFNKTLDFLSSDKQIALYEKIELNRARSRDLFGPGFIREQMEDRRALQTEMVTSIQELLTPDEFFEYELRESRTANSMRQTMSGFDYTEKEFRDIFAIRNESQQLSQSAFMNMRDPQTRATMAETREDQERRIAEYLGTERFEELKRLQDPVYRSIVAIGDRYGSSQASIISAYEVTSDFIAQANELRVDQSLSSDERRSQIQQLSEASLEEIEDLVGEEAAASIETNAFRGRRRGYRQ
jgi:hypothetical protein